MKSENSKRSIPKEISFVRTRSRTQRNSCIDVGSQFVVEICCDHSLWNPSMYLLSFSFHFDFTSCSCDRAKQKGRCNSFLRESWQFPNRALYKLQYISSPSRILISRHKSAWFS